MKNLLRDKDVTKYCVDTLKKLGADKSQVNYTHLIKKEMCVEGDKVSLLRTIHSDEVFLKTIKNNKEASLKINKIDKTNLEEACKDVIALASSSPEDPHKDIAAIDEAGSFSHGSKEPDFDQMYQKLINFKQEALRKYPKIILRDVVLYHQYNKEFIQNSNGVDFEVGNGSYEIFTMFTAKDGKKTSSFNYDAIARKDLNGEFINWGQIDELLRQTQMQTVLRSVPENFKGDVILTPLCLLEMLSYLVNELKDGKHITNTSLMKGKLNQLVLSKKFTFKSLALGDQFAEKFFVTPDGFRADDLTLFDKGVLKSNLLSQYGANKTAQERANNFGVNFQVESGEKSLSDMIKVVKKGILLQRFSGGSPAANGDFSGVAKNSFYIDDGEVSYPVNETMITGNIIDMFKNIENISTDFVNYGHSILPWIQVCGMSISGK